MADQLPAERRPGPAADRRGTRPAAADHGAVLPARDQPGQRAGPRQDRPRRPVQHRRRRHGPGDDPGRRRARRAHPQVRREDRPPPTPQPPRTFRRGRSRTPPGTRASSTTSSTSRPAAASGTASCPRSTRRSCSPACSPAPPTSTATRRTRPRSAAWPTRSTAGPTGTGRATAARRSPTAGSPRPASSRTATGLRRGAAALPARPRLADAPAAAGELRRLLRHLPVEGDLRPRAALLRAAVHPPALAPVDRLPRHPRRVHARARQRLLREQPAGDLRAAGVRDPQPAEFDGYGEHCWGFTACDGPGWVKRVVNGVERQFFDYIARGAPFGPDDGTVAPWVVVASLPFAPEIVIPTVRHFARLDLGMTAPYGFKPSFNQTFAVDDSPTGWWVTPVPLRHRPGAGRADDRELPHRPDLGHHAPLPGRRRGTAAGRVHRRLALKRRSCASMAAAILKKSP